jgi:hypothetical protein
MNLLLIGLTIVAFIVVVLSLLFDKISAGGVKDFWPGAIFVLALVLAGSVLYVIKTSRTANKWRAVRGIRRWLAKVDRHMQKRQRTPTDVNLP